MKHEMEIVGMATVGEKGQVVIPADARKALGLVKGDRLAVMCKGREVIGLVKLSEMKRFVSELSKKLGLEKK